jgi:Zinc finger, C2H2 type
MATQLPQYRAAAAQMGLLTTVSQLPPDIKKQYIFTFNTATASFQSPLDLSVKPSFVFSASDFATVDPLPPPITPPCTPSPLKKRYREEYEQLEKENDRKMQKVEREKTPTKPTKSAPVKSSKKRARSSSDGETAEVRPAKESRKTKAVRKLKFDEYTSSPVSGTIIRSIDDINSSSQPQESGDIDPEYNIVEVTDEVKAELAAIPNVIGGYACKLCRQAFEDCFGLARHRCSCIVLLEYLCPECGKRFNSPANLASHRRWHKPRDQVMKKTQLTDSSEPEPQFPCSECGKQFKRQAYLKKHLLTHKGRPDVDSAINNNSEENSNQNLTPATFETNSNNSKDFTLFPFGPDLGATKADMPQTVFKYEYVNLRNDSVGDESNMSSVSEASSTQLHIDHGHDRFTEDDHIAAAALAHLRDGVIRHTTAFSV